jgi:hypothetical protein
MPAPRRCRNRAVRCSVRIPDEGTSVQESPENGTCILGIEDELVILQELYESWSSRAPVIYGAAYISCHLEGH